MRSLILPRCEEAMTTNTSSTLDRDCTKCVDNEDSGSTMNSNSSTISDNDSLYDTLRADEDAESVEMIYSCSNASLYFITDSGRVTMSSNLNTARIFRVSGKDAESVPTYYLQVHTFVYPLVRQVSPCVRTEFGAILFPNCNPDETIDAECQSIGLIVPEDHEEELILILENILEVKIAFCNTSEKPSSNATHANKIANTVVSGAQSVSDFLVQNAQKAEQFLDGGTPKIIEKINPSNRERRFAPCVTNGIKIAKDVTAVTANVTGFVASKVGAATFCLGQFLAPHIRRNGSRILSRTTGMDVVQATEKIDSLMDVTAGAVEGLATIYNGLETSAVIFGRSLANNTVQIVKHRYGDPAAEFTQDTFETVRNGIEIGTNIRMFKPKTLAKTAMKGVVIDKQFKSATTCERKNESPRTIPREQSFSTRSNSSISQSSVMDVEISTKPAEESREPVVPSSSNQLKSVQPETSETLESSSVSESQAISNKLI